MTPSYRTCKVYQYRDASAFVSDTLQKSFHWDMLGYLFGVDEPRNDTVYACRKPYRNTLVKYGCSDETFFNVIVPTLWGNDDEIMVEVSW